MMHLHIVPRNTSSGLPLKQIPGKPRCKTGTTPRRSLERLVVERETRAILERVDRRRDGREPGAEMILAAIAAVTPQEAEELKQKLREVLEPYLAKADAAVAPGRAHIRVFMALTPTASIPGTDRGEH